VSAIEDQYMPQTDVQPTVEDVTRLAFQLSPQDLLRLLQDIQERLYTGEMMAIAEDGFQEWNDPEEDIYDAEESDTWKEEDISDLSRFSLQYAEMIYFEDEELI
jgi:hypothetical protein